MLLKQAVREMEDELAATEQRQRQLVIDRDGLTLRRGELEQSLADLDEELDICFEEDEGELARGLIKRKLQTQRLLKQLTAKLGATEKELLGSQQALFENRASLESMRQKVELFSEQPLNSGGGQSISENADWYSQETGVSDSDVEVSFLREKKRRATA